MSENDMTAPTNPYADWPLHHLLFVKLRDGGGGAAVSYTHLTLPTTPYV